MGRKPYKNFNLPKGMRARKRGKNIYYYLDTGARPRKEISLGSDYAMAVQKWAQLTMHKQPDVITFRYVADQYFKHVVPSKAEKTQKVNHEEIKHLLMFFDNPPAPLDKIEPKHIRMFLDWRLEQAKKNATHRGLVATAKTGTVVANREKALFSHIWNYSREYGYTSKENPCAGVKGFRETGRKDILVTDELLYKAISFADKPTQFALKLAYLTGQRPADVLRMSQTDMKDGYLFVRQGKTKVKLRIQIIGKLAETLREIQEYKDSIPGNIHSLALLVDEKGFQLTSGAFRGRFRKARELAGIDKQQFQFRDLRAKAATQIDDDNGIRQAQALLGHTNESMTEQYIRNRIGKKVKPVQ